MSGLEVVRAIACITQIADLGAEISVRLCSFYRTVKNYNDPMRSLASEVSLTCSLLHQLSKALEKDYETNICSPGAFDTTHDLLRECSAVFGKIESEVEKVDQEKGMNWVLGGIYGPNLNLIGSNLERLKSTMLLMLNVLVYAGQLRGGRVAHDQKHLIQCLLEEKNANDAKFHQLNQSEATVTSKADEHIHKSGRAGSIHSAPSASKVSYSKPVAGTLTEQHVPRLDDRNSSISFQSDTSTLLNEDDDCVIVIPRKRDPNKIHSRDLGRHRIGGVYSERIPLAIRRHKQTKNGDSKGHERTTYPEVPGEDSRNPTYYDRSPEYMPKSNYSNPELQKTDESGNTMSERKMTNDDRSSSFPYKVMTVEQELEVLILRWTTLTREEMKMIT